MENTKVLLVDDENDILEFLSFNLEKEGYITATSNNGEEAIIMAKKIMPDLIILDVMMPGMDGIETCKELRLHPELNHTIIVFLTARSEDYSQIAGLNSGADDYITKPIKPRVLNSRIKALLRRRRPLIKEESNSVTIIEVGPLKIDRDSYVVYKNNTPLSLPKKEFEILSLLAQKPGKVFSRETILSSIWGNDVVVSNRTIDVHIRKLREKIGDLYIETIKGVGYKLSLHDE